MSWRNTTPPNEPLRVRFSRVSHNVKTGPIPVSTSSPSTCPQSCGWYGRGCYAEYNHVARWWRATARTGLSWEDFCRAVAKLPAGQLWRHNEAGDLPGRGEDVDVHAVMRLVEANRGRRGFTYTHKSPQQWGWLLRYANREGFAINISCDAFERLDALKLQFGRTVPLTVVVPSDWPQRSRTPAGHHVVVCPAQTTEGLTCHRCGLCGVSGRAAVVAFRAHGQSASRVSIGATNYRLPMVK